MIPEIIRVAPWVEDCANCGMHGRIVYPDGSKSKDFASKETALVYIADQRELGAFTTEEHDTLKWMILSTSWQYSEPSAEQIQDMINILDMLTDLTVIPPKEVDMKDAYFNTGNETGH